MFSRTVPENRTVSCSTTAICSRSHASEQSRDVAAVERHAALGRVVEARDERGERRLAGAGGAREREPLAGRELEADAVERGPLAGVGERDVLELDARRVARGPR